MSATKIAATLLIAAGAVGLIYGRFSFTKDAHSTTIGPISMSMRERETVVVPVWGAVAAIVAGSLVLMTRKRGYSS